MKEISSVDSGEYKCRSSNEHGEKLSEALTLNVLYPPKSVSVSISPSGVILEGSSVTLTCSSDGNPPVEYNWIKGTSSVGKGKTYTKKKISSVDSGEYKCRSSNEHGEKLSEALTLNVLYLQVEVPERVIEGDEVTLTCKTSFSLSDRPTFTWYRNGHPLSSNTDQLHLQPVSREDAGSYDCAVWSKNLYSPEVTLNVRYPPKSISVSISPSGEIVEGRSVNLTCRSDANPPVQNYTWFKGTSSVGKGETYTMKKISSVDSGEYKCRSSNEHGEKLSEALTLNVLYPPKSVSVSISPSGETAEGSSVNLTCSSDANPPVQNYTWFKEGGSSPVGSGHSYRAPQRGSYYCEAQNEHGSQKSAAVTVKGVWNSALYAVIGVTAGCGCLSIIIAVFCVRRKRRGSSADDKNQTQNVDPNAKDDTNTALDPVSRTSDDVYNTLATVHSSPSDDLYSALDPQSRSPEYGTLATVRNKH
uniref:Ig-like domain-containing protein n=1 Tax=Pygocentrus nattereri TaxID=42514 RepID=A0AAR2L916_PYGNA